MKYKGFEIVKVCEYHVWKNGLHLFVDTSLKDCKDFLNKIFINSFKFINL